MKSLAFEPGLSLLHSLSLGQHAKLILPIMGYVVRFLAAVYGE